MSLDKKMQIIIIVKIQYINNTSGLYNEIRPVHNVQSINTYIMCTDRTSKLIPI
jgi:hypothetical protein